MRTSKLALWVTTICLLLTTGLSPAHAAATLTESGQIAATKADIREVVADNAALVAEIAAVRESLASERQSTAQLGAIIKALYRAGELPELQYCYLIKGKTNTGVHLDVDTTKKRKRGGKIFAF